MTNQSARDKREKEIRVSVYYTNKNKLNTHAHICTYNKDRRKEREKKRKAGV